MGSTGVKLVVFRIFVLPPFARPPERSAQRAAPEKMQKCTISRIHGERGHEILSFFARFSLTTRDIFFNKNDDFAHSWGDGGGFYAIFYAIFDVFAHARPHYTRSTPTTGGWGRAKREHLPYTPSGRNWPLFRIFRRFCSSLFKRI